MQNIYVLQQSAFTREKYNEINTTIPKNSTRVSTLGYLLGYSVSSDNGNGGFVSCHYSYAFFRCVMTDTALKPKGRPPGVTGSDFR